jgi:hypothetical protein
MVSIRTHIGWLTTWNEGNTMWHFKYLLMLRESQLQFWVNLLWCGVDYLYGIELCNNTRVVFFEQLLHTTRGDNFRGTRCKLLESIFLPFLRESHV